MSQALLSVIFLAAVFLCGSASAQAQGAGLYFDAKLSSPAVKLDHLFDDWNATSKGEYAYGQLKVGTWFQLNEYLTLGIEQRKYHFLDFTYETALFYGQLENQNIPIGDYPLNLSVNSSNSNAVFVRYFMPVNEAFTASVAAYLLKGSYGQIGELSGLGSVSESGDGSEIYTYEYSLNYLYDRNELFEHNAPGSSGYGHSFDLFLEYQVTENISVNLSVEDLFHRMYWNPINRDSGCFSRLATIGQSCLLNTSLMRFNQSLPESKALSVSYAVNEYNLSVLALDQSYHKELWFAAGWNIYGVAYDQYNESYKLTYESDHLTVKWSFDDYDLNNANNWQVTLAANWPFE